VSNEKVDSEFLEFERLVSDVMTSQDLLLQRLDKIDALLTSRTQQENDTLNQKLDSLLKAVEDLERTRLEHEGARLAEWKHELSTIRDHMLLDEKHLPVDF